MTTNLFLDTEWADLAGDELVSLALISGDGRRQFYAERDPLPSAPTTFVRESVYPLLDRGAAALADHAFTASLRAFLDAVPDPLIIFDYAHDWVMFQMAWRGFVRPGQAPLEESLDHGIAQRLLTSDLVSMILEDWFLAHPREAARRHHAMVDANALRVACLAADGQMQAEWSPSWRQFRK
jgi:hypothetical protein